MELTDVCVTVNVALTGPVSAPCVVPAIETVAPSLSVMFRLAVRLAGLAFNVMSGSPLVIAVRRGDGDRLGRLHDGVVDHRDRDRGGGAASGNRDRVRDGGVIGTFAGSAPQREGHHRVGRTDRRLRDGERGVDRSRLIAVGRAGDRDRGACRCR